jgi:3-oxoacyl-[acyl-carrier protein] reductase
MRFQGKVALVTGSTRGIGRAIALSLAENGATVVINGRDEEKGKSVAKEIKALGRESIFIRADVRNQKQVNNMVAQIVETFGRIDVLVSNAAVFAESIPIVELEEEEWDRVMNVNLKGVFNCSKVVSKHMIRQRTGKIVNVASFTGKTGRVVYSKFGSPTKAHYCASKAGIISLTKSLAFELAPYNINVNAVAAGSVATEATSEEKKKMIIPLVPLGRVGTTQDVAAAVVFLASPEASFITGEILDVNGGTLMD